MTYTSKISALLIIYNEVDHIKEVIDTVSFADEIIVVDSYSNDGTLEILAELKDVKVIKHKFKNFADQRNFAISQATNNWILFIDADERIPEPLKNEILEVVKTESDIAGYMVKRLHFFNRKPVNFSGYQTDTTYRIFKNGKVAYDPKKVVHEIPVIDGKSAILNHKMLHYSFTTKKDFKTKIEYYSKLQADELFKKGKKSTPFHLLIKPAYKFVYNYIFRFGFLDGKEGFNICYINAYGVYYRFKELKRLSHNSSKK